jgi:hypothetical protein
LAEAGCGCGGQHEEASAAPRPAARTTAALRRAWARYACAEREMVTIRLLSHRTPVNPLTVDAFRALAQALVDTGYHARSTWVYNCRDIRQTDPAATSRRSLHAYGLAVDVDPRTNPHRRNVQGRIRFSAAPTQDEREADVRAGRAGTAFTPAQVRAVEAIRTVDGLQVFGWGGRWRSSHDAMHFEIRLTPIELARGLASSAVAPGGAGEVARTCEAYELEDHEAEQYEVRQYESEQYEALDESEVTQQAQLPTVDVISPFRPGPYQLPLEMTNSDLITCIDRAERDPEVNQLCAAVADVTGNPAMPPFAAMNPVDMLYVGSLAKLYVMYVAFELKHRVEVQAKRMIAHGLSTATPGWQNSVFAVLRSEWKPIMDKRFRGLPPQFPRLKDIVTLSPTGEARFVSANLSRAELDGIGMEGHPKGKFRDWMALMMRWSNNTAASWCIQALGYSYLNGTLEAGGFFRRLVPSRRAGVGLWISGDYAGHDWLPANKAGQALTPRWATLQRRKSSNFTGTAFQVGRLMTLLGQGRLVDAASSADMLSLMSATEGGIGSYLKTALATANPPRRVSVVKSKIGYGDDKFSHDAAVIWVTSQRPGEPEVRYVSVVLGSPPEKARRDLNKLAVHLHDCIIARHPGAGP